MRFEKSFEASGVPTFRSILKWCDIEVQPGLIGRAIQVDESLVFIEGTSGGITYDSKSRVDPFVKVLSVGTGEVRALPSTDWHPGRLDTGPDDYYSYNYYNDLPVVYADVTVEHTNGSKGTVTCRFKPADLGKACFTSNTLTFFRTLLGYNYPTETYQLNWCSFQMALRGFDLELPGGESSKESSWGFFIQSLRLKVDDRGVKAIEKRAGVGATLDMLRTKRPHLFQFFQWLHSGKSYQKATNNQLISAFLSEHGDDYEALVAALSAAQTAKVDFSRYDTEYNVDHTRTYCLMLPGAQGKLEVELAKTEWQYQKNVRKQALALGIDPKAHKRLLAAIEAKDFPISLFHKSGQPDHIINVEFDLWEKALKRPGWHDTLLEIARSAATRSTYEKNVTPYFAFLFHIEKYLKRHTGKVWKAIPKFVSSQWELEMDDDAKEGATSNKRSALTPVADNEERTITVPYASLSVTGARTTYCYSLRYYVFEENTLDLLSGDPVQHELEQKLNGRDDYGLMYYTLTGSATATGYPSFLIIFERLPSKELGTRVHFHRVHPNRSKKGVSTPASRLIEECYRYMAGNIRAEDIHAQQGDLIFLKKEGDLLDDVDSKAISDFESHRFISSSDKPLVLYERPTKSIKNRLGFIFAADPFTVAHPEHEDLTALPSGLYEVRRCRTWEANPKAIWSYTFD